MPDLIRETSEPLELQVDAEMLAGAAMGTPSWKRLDFAVQHQEQTQWCWAAVTVSVADFYETPTAWTQCKLVCDMREVSGCCQNGTSKECNQPWYLDRALDGVGALASVDAVAQPGPGAAVPSQVERQIESQRPVGVRIGWRGGGGHVVVLEGYSDDGAMVAVEDPWFGSSDMPVGVLYDSYEGTGSWTHVFYTQPPA